MSYSELSLSRAIVIAGAALYVGAVTALSAVSRPTTADELQVALPRFVQTLTAAGDRYLASNVATFRAIVASTENMHEDNYRVQAQIQRDASWMNPAHEDNYYVAAAILPWNGELDAAQEILARAMKARPFDWQPAFYYAFDLYQIKQDAVAAADALIRAAPQVRSEKSRTTMESLAYAWYEKGYDPHTALQVMEASAQNARSGALRHYLLARAERLRGLLALRDAATAFQEKLGRPPREIKELVTRGLIDSIPEDPFGVGFVLDDEGVPAIPGRSTGNKR